ncbi:MAG: hypothetical protein CVV17_03310 [Gammaproteobacteria bacterium HGW-Gammaproteobacteria-7]|nr:MAG: hypothetical protein CVV17_03310 [Gammaproteobacteria bacterium HGW-Gammaproteobacteria-7]
MPDLNKQELRRLAENAAFMYPTFAENAEAASLFDPVSGPEVVLALLDEIDLLRHGVKGDFDLDAWLEWAKEAAKLRAEVDLLRQDAAMRITPEQSKAIARRGRDAIIKAACADAGVADHD